MAFIRRKIDWTAPVTEPDSGLEMTPEHNPYIAEVEKNDTDVDREWTITFTQKETDNTVLVKVSQSHGSTYTVLYYDKEGSQTAEHTSGQKVQLSYKGHEVHTGTTDEYGKFEVRLPMNYILIGRILPSDGNLVIEEFGAFYIDNNEYTGEAPHFSELDQPENSILVLPSNRMVPLQRSIPVRCDNITRRHNTDRFCLLPDQPYTLYMSVSRQNGSVIITAVNDEEIESDNPTFSWAENTLTYSDNVLDNFEQYKVDMASGLEGYTDRSCELYLDQPTVAPINVKVDGAEGPIKITFEGADGIQLSENGITEMYTNANGEASAKAIYNGDGGEVNVSVEPFVDESSTSTYNFSTTPTSIEFPQAGNTQTVQVSSQKTTETTYKTTDETTKTWTPSTNIVEFDVIEETETVPSQINCTLEIVESYTSVYFMVGGKIYWPGSIYKLENNAPKNITVSNYKNGSKDGDGTTYQFTENLTTNPTTQTHTYNTGGKSYTLTLSQPAFAANENVVHNMEAYMTVQGAEGLILEAIPITVWNEEEVLASFIGNNTREYEATTSFLVQNLRFRLPTFTSSPDMDAYLSSIKVEVPTSLKTRDRSKSVNVLLDSLKLLVDNTAQTILASMGSSEESADGTYRLIKFAPNSEGTNNYHNKESYSLRLELSLNLTTD